MAQVTDEPAADAVLELPPATSSTAGAPQTAKKLSDVTASCELAGFFTASGNNHLDGTRFFQNMHKLGAQRVQCGDGSASEMEAGDSSMEDGSSEEETDDSGDEEEGRARNRAAAPDTTGAPSDSDEAGSQGGSSRDDACEDLDAADPAEAAGSRSRAQRKAEPAFEQLLQAFEV